MIQASLPIDTLLRDTVPADWAPDALPSLAGINELGFDTETTGLRWWAGDRPVGIAVAHGAKSVYLPFGHRAGGNLPEARVREWAQRELRNKHLVGLNVRFDVHMMKSWGIDLEAQGCTFGDVGHYAALLDDHRTERFRDRGRTGFSLEDIAQDYVGEGKVQGLLGERIADYHASQVARYARQDASLVVRILEKMQPELDAQNLGQVVALENAVIPVVIEMERNAAPIDVEKLDAWCKSSERELSALHMRLFGILGFAFNPDKPDDMARLFAMRGHKSDMTTDSGAPSYADAVLERLEKKDHVIGLVRQTAHLSDLRAKYLLAYRRAVGSDGLLRYSLHQLRGDQYGTVSGRFSSSQPIRGEGANIQQVMAVEKQRRLHGDRYTIRELFIPGEGLFFKSDAKQIEYRIFAHYTNAPAILDAYAKDREADFHAMVGEIIRPYRSDFDRKRVKNLNFAKLYGAGTRKIAAMLGLDIAAADDFIRIYDRAFPQAKEMLKAAMDTAEKRGYVRTILGRRTRFPNLERLHKALNGVIQGSAADVMKQKLIDLYQERKALGLTLRMTVHDEVTGDVPDAEAARRVADVLDRQTIPFRVPILWDSATGRNWSECK